jgi:hypothetical protein
MTDTPTLEDHLMASGFVLQAFMLQMSLEIAKTKDDPSAWSKAFVTMITERIDANESRHPNSDEHPVHELARSQVDTLGTHLDQILKI